MAVEAMNARSGMSGAIILRCSVYVASALVSIIVTVSKPKMKATAVHIKPR